jgi:hypothetical protein
MHFDGGKEKDINDFLWIILSIHFNVNNVQSVSPSQWTLDVYGIMIP